MSEAPGNAEAIAAGDAFLAPFQDMPQATPADDARAAAIGRQSSAAPWLIAGVVGLGLLAIFMGDE